jgi:hypothetical protein
MKSVISIILLWSAFSLAAEVRKVVTHIQELEYKDGILNVSYQIGGGCAKHTPAIEVRFKKTSKFIGIATVTIVDVADKPDFCEALLYPQASFDLKSKLKEASRNLDISLVQVQLPKVALFLD